MNDTMGLRLGQDGTIDPNSIFSEKRFASAVNVNEIVNEQLKNAVADKGFDIRNISDEQLAIIATEQLSPERIQEITLSALQSDPETMAYLQDELLVANANKMRETGEQMTLDEQNAFLNERFGEAVSTAINTFGGVQQDVTLRNIPGAGSGSDSDSNPRLGIVYSAGDAPVPNMNFDDYDSKYKMLEKQMLDIDKQLSSGDVDSYIDADILEAEKAFIDKQMSDVKEKMMLIADGAGYDDREAVIDLMKKSKPQAPDYLSPEEAEYVSQQIEERYQRTGGNVSGFGFGVEPSAALQDLISDPTYGEYARNLVGWKDDIHGEEARARKSLNRAAKRANAKEMAQQLQARNFPRDISGTSRSALALDIKDIVVGTGFDQSTQFLNDNYEPYDPDDINIDKLEISGYTEVPDYQGAYYLEARDPESGNPVKIKMPPLMAESVGRRLEQHVGNANSYDVSMDRDWETRYL